MIQTHLPECFVSATGKAYSKNIEKDCHLRPVRQRNGHAIIQVGNATHRLDKLILTTLKGQDRKLKAVQHLDNDPLNCSLSNLTWVKRTSTGGRKCGFVHSKETLQTISSKVYGRSNSKFVGFWLVNGRPFESLADAKQFTRINPKIIAKNCREKATFQGQTFDFVKKGDKLAII